MPQENLEAVRRMFEAVNAGDFETALEDIADDVVLMLEGGASRLAGDGAIGKTAFVRWFTDWFATFESGYRFELEDLRGDGDRVSATVIHHARGRLSGATVTMRTSWVYEFRDGTIVRCHGTSE